MMGNLPDISNLLKAQEYMLGSEQRLREEAKMVEEGRKKIREGIVNIYKAAQVSPEECDHPVTEYQGMGMNYCKCCDTNIS